MKGTERYVNDCKLLRFLLFMADITKCHLFVALTLMQSGEIRINCMKYPSSEFSYVSGHKCPFLQSLCWLAIWHVPFSFRYNVERM